jgi:hypothetical protein
MVLVQTMTGHFQGRKAASTPPLLLLLLTLLPRVA